MVITRSTGSLRTVLWSLVKSMSDHLCKRELNITSQYRHDFGGGGGGGVVSGWEEGSKGKREMMSICRSICTTSGIYRL